MIQGRYGFQFPDDLRAFLERALPTSGGFVNWRKETPNQIEGRLAWPTDGICFDIEHNGFWHEPWGRRPSGLAEAIAAAKRHVSTAPTMIPICSHRYIPDRPTDAGGIRCSRSTRPTSSTTGPIFGTTSRMSSTTTSELHPISWSHPSAGSNSGRTWSTPMRSPSSRRSNRTEPPPNKRLKADDRNSRAPTAPSLLRSRLSRETLCRQCGVGPFLRVSHGPGSDVPISS